MTNKPKISQNSRGPHPQRTNVPLPCVQQDSRDRGNGPGSVMLIICHYRCATLSRFSGWVGGGFSRLSAANTLIPSLSPNFFPRALHVMLHMGQMFKSVCLLIPAKNTTTILYLSFQHMQQPRAAAGMRRMTDSLGPSAAPPASREPGHEGQAPLL